MKISLILAISRNNVIGNNNKLPWRLKDDLLNFKRITEGHHVVMGRKTFDSIGKPLKGRTNMVLSKSNKDLDKINDVFSFDNIEDCIKFAKENNETELFIIGGAQIYDLFLPLASTIYMTKVMTVIEGDTKFFFDMEQWVLVDEKLFYQNEYNEYAFDFLTFKKTSYGEVLF